MFFLISTAGTSDKQLMARLILMIEDNQQIAKSVQLSLQPDGFCLTVASDLAAARKYAPFTGFELALVDVMLPDGSGLDFCAELRQANPALPLLIITARADEESVVRGLSLAADYVRKPFGKRELLARIQKVLGQRVAAPARLEFEGLTLDPGAHEARYGESSVKLRPKEFAVLSLLVLSGGETVARERILRHVDREGEMFDRSLDAHLSRIRRAFQAAGLSSFELAAVPGVGYRLQKRKKAA